MKIILLLFTFSYSLCAHDYTWVGKKNGLWEDKSNWISSKNISDYPKTKDDSALFSTGNSEIRTKSSITIGSLIVKKDFNGKIILGAPMKIDGTGEQDGRFKMKGGTFNAGSYDLNIANGFLLDQGTFLAGTSKITLEGAPANKSCDFILTGAKNTKFERGGSTVILNASGKLYCPWPTDCFENLSLSNKEGVEILLAPGSTIKVFGKLNLGNATLKGKNSTILLWGTASSNEKSVIEGVTIGLVQSKIPKLNYYNLISCLSMGRANADRLFKFEDNTCIKNSLSCWTDDLVVSTANKNISIGSNLILGKKDKKNNLTMNLLNSVIKIGGDLQNQYECKINSGNSTIIFNAEKGYKKINSGGQILNNLIFESPDSNTTWILENSLRSKGNIDIKSGVFDTSCFNYPINIKKNFTLNKNGKLIANSSTITCYGNWNMEKMNGFNAETSTVKLMGNNKSISACVFYNLEITGSYVLKGNIKIQNKIKLGENAILDKNNFKVIINENR
jgi:hypothetical protein